MNLQQIILSLSGFWEERGCLIVQPYDIEVGAGTLHPETFFRILTDRPYKVAYVQPSRRPADGRYGENPFRLMKHLQFQVILKPSPLEVQELYIQSLRHIGIDLDYHDLRFEEDNWEAPTLGAWGVGWQVLLDGMEITQFTYMQQAGGMDCKPVPVELTYGLERIAMFINQVPSVFEMPYSADLPYGAVRRWEEQEISKYYFEVADVAEAQRQFDFFEAEAERCLGEKLILPAYECVLKLSHLFNILDARGAVSTTNRTNLIQRIRHLAFQCALGYVERGKA
jgi:glycyl-tRNA synthetase alpha chain